LKKKKRKEGEEKNDLKGKKTVTNKMPKKKGNTWKKGTEKKRGGGWAVGTKKP